MLIDAFDCVSPLDYRYYATNPKLVELLGPYVTRHFRHARAVEDPVFANAVGFWRFAQRLSHTG